MDLQKHNLEYAKALLLELKNYNNNHSKQLKKVLREFINGSKGDLSSLISSIPLPKEHAYYSLYNMDINIYIHEILFPPETVM